jgi:hypothetical protein
MAATKGLIEVDLPVSPSDASASGLAVSARYYFNLTLHSDEWQGWRLEIVDASGQAVQITPLDALSAH